jgi:chemotaxis protein MotB
MPDYLVEVTGHTDDRPIHTPAFPSNLELSLARAAAVARELAAGAPDLEARIVVAGMGEHRPLVPNADDDARARNRRVEIRLRARDAGA